MRSLSPLAASDPDGPLPAAAVDALPSAVAAGVAGAPTRVHPQPLHSRNVGILCDDPQRPEAVLLQQAATALGARVALVRSPLDEASGQPALAHTARVLGRLYDAVLCVDLSPAVVSYLRDAVDIPVISDETGEWGALCGPNPPPGEDPRVLLRALLAGLGA